MGWDLDTNRPCQGSTAPSFPLTGLVLVTDLLTLKIGYLECRDHEHTVTNHLMQLDLEGLRVHTVPYVLLHQ